MHLTDLNNSMLPTAQSITGVNYHWLKESTSASEIYLKG